MFWLGDWGPVKCVTFLGAGGGLKISVGQLGLSSLQKCWTCVSCLTPVDMIKTSLLNLVDHVGSVRSIMKFHRSTPVSLNRIVHMQGTWKICQWSYQSFYIQGSKGIGKSKTLASDPQDCERSNWVGVLLSGGLDGKRSCSCQNIHKEGSVSWVLSVFLFITVTFYYPVLKEVRWRITVLTLPNRCRVPNFQASIT